MECCCYLRNVQDLLADGKTPYERRFGEPFKGPTVLFAAMVEYHPSSPKDQMRIHQFGKKVLLDLEELEMMDASDIYSRRIKAKEVLISQKDGEFVSPIAAGTAKLFGRDNTV